MVLHYHTIYPINIQSYLLRFGFIGVLGSNYLPNPHGVLCSLIQSFFAPQKSLHTGMSMVLVLSNWVITPI